VAGKNESFSGLYTHCPIFVSDFNQICINVGQDCPVDMGDTHD